MADATITMVPSDLTADQWIRETALHHALELRSGAMGDLDALRIAAQFERYIRTGETEEKT